MPRYYDLVTIMGPTASGKTSVAVDLALLTQGEVLSGDSRQVYRRMDLGTGKDLEEYNREGEYVPYHLIDLCEPGEKYNVYRYQKDFQEAYERIPPERQPILCGGSGLYIESVLRPERYDLPSVPEDEAFRAQRENSSKEDLIRELESYESLHNTTDTTSRRRLIRAIEIARYRHRDREEPETRREKGGRDFQGPIFVIDISREERRERISSRLSGRIQGGMLSEVEELLKSGIAAEDLIYYGLEYKYLTEYLLGLYSYEEMFKKLETSIHQFAKRQMTWIRGMERRGFTLHYITPKGSSLETAREILGVLLCG